MIERKEQEELREKQIEQDRLRQNCFISKNQIAYTFDNIDENTDKDIIKKAKNYVKYFEEMRKDNVGLLLFGNVGSGKTFLACSIANEIITEYSYTVKMRNFAQILNDLQDIMLGRIYSRIIEMCLPLRVTGLDRRKIQSKEKLKKAQNLIDE